ncbi:MAG: alanine racemase [Clostridiales bacterium]|nr:alanine racemase [Clostridiales bacterium]
MDLGVGNTFLEVDLQKIKANLNRIRDHIGKGCEVMPVLKANAAGMGLEKMGLFMSGECGVNLVAVAQVYEAVKLKEAGVDCEIFVMGGVPYDNVASAVEYGIQMPVFENEFADFVNGEAKKQDKKVKLHIKIETGMNRIGVKPGRALDELVDYIKNLESIEIVGVYTHLVESQAADKSFSHRQHDLFKEALGQLDRKGINPRYIHVCNSAATVWFTEAYYTHVRPGRLVYGMDPNGDEKNKLGLEFPIKWYAFVTNLKRIDAGETVGYNKFFKADRPIRMATLSFGYGDGYNRNLVLKGGHVLIKGKRAPFLDMCMDQSFVDVTAIEDVKLNDRAVLLGRGGKEEISLHDFSAMLGEGYMNAMANIGQRVRRIYKSCHAERSEGS